MGLYKKASKVYGDCVVKFNIELCEKAIAANSDQGVAAAVLDPVTKLMLHNAGEIVLDETEVSSIHKFCEQQKKRKSEDLGDKAVNPIPSDWPKGLTLAPLPEGTNDFSWADERVTVRESKGAENVGLSIVVPTFNRSRILDITLSCLAAQITDFPYEVIVADDGSKEDLAKVVRKYEDRLDIKLVRQRDYGYQLCAVRNLGLRTAKYDYVSILDCDMAPGRIWVQSYMELLLSNDDVALIGPRKYIDTEELTADDIEKNPDLLASLPEVRTNSTVGNTVKDTVSVDWRLEHFAKTDNLRLCDSPFRYFSGGNVAFARKWLDKAGWFDEEFTHWGGEDNEFGYRLYRAGCYFRAVDGGMAYHQEPPGKENETDRAAGKQITIKIVQQKVPYFYRKIEDLKQSVMKKVPLVSIYIPAYNCKETIERCVNSALNQTVSDLEVCICDDGSTDGTGELLRSLYSGHPRVRFVSRENGGIGAASNTAVKLTRGFYIGQLDSDDYLEPDAVEVCLREFFADKKLACVYTTNRNVDAEGKLISNGYNWPQYSREKLTTAMICHHFRMFTARAWNLTEGFDEKIVNAVDYDMYLKLSEVGPFKHVNKICYNRVLHGDNTSIKQLGEQKENHFRVVNEYLSRQGVRDFRYIPKDLGDDSSRKYVFEVSKF